MNKKPIIGVVGAGSWGGTLAYLIAKNGYEVNIWTFSNEEYDSLKNKKVLLRPKTLKIPKTLRPSKDLKSICKTSDILLIAVPSKFFKSTLQKIKSFGINKTTILLSATKGLIDNTFTTSMVIKKIFPKNNFAILSGPNIALDVIEGSPIISVIASPKIKTAISLQEIVSTKTFRLYPNTDVIGVETAGAFKNVIAIASGMSDGLGFSASSKAAIISRGLIEIIRLSMKLGANLKTMYSAAGIGDLIATCTSPNSRNYRVGYSLAKGKKLSVILQELGEVAEGVETVKAMKHLANKYKIDAPITDGIYDIIVNGKSPKNAIANLLTRPLPKKELAF